MKRIYYDSVKKQLNCPPGQWDEADVAVHVVVHSGKSVSDAIDTLTDLLTDLTNSTTHDDEHNSTESAVSSCSCVYMNATDDNRFV